MNEAIYVLEQAVFEAKTEIRELARRSNAKEIKYREKLILEIEEAIGVLKNHKQT